MPPDSESLLFPRAPRPTGRLELLRSAAGRACDACRKRKARCDGAERRGTACSLCVRTGLGCTYLDKYTPRGPTMSYVESLERRSQQVQRILERYATPQEIARKLGLDVPQLEASYFDFPDLGQPASEPSIQAILPAYVDSLRKFQSPESPVKSELVDDGDFTWDDLSEEMERLAMDRGFSHRVYGKSSGQLFIQSARTLKRSEYGEKADTIKVRTDQRAVPEMWQPIKWVQDAWRSEKFVLPSGAAPFPPDDLVRSLIALFFRHVAPTLPVLDRRNFEDAFNRRLHMESSQLEALVLLVCAIGSTYSNDPRITSNSGNTPGDGWRYFLHGRDWLQCLTPPTLPELQILTLTAYYMRFLSHPHSAWIVVGVGMRRALDVGCHRNIRICHIAKESERWEWWKVFGCLVLLDRDLSAHLGRSPAFHDEDTDIDFSREIGKDTKDSPGDTYMSCALRLSGIMAFLLRSVYAVRKPALLRCAAADYDVSIVSVLAAAARRWRASLPDHLKWDPSCTDDVRLEQSSLLHALYSWFLILLHYPFIFSSSHSSKHDRRAYMAICEDAALECSNILACQARRTPTIFPQSRMAALASGVFLQILIWINLKEDPMADVQALRLGVERCISVLRNAQEKWYHGRVYANLLDDLSASEPVKTTMDNTLNSSAAPSTDPIDSLPSFLPGTPITPLTAESPASIFGLQNHPWFPFTFESISYVSDPSGGYCFEGPGEGSNALREE
ncbi:hypothetical protein BS47DRAFT_1485011 [Hydnum rufescens UP504]|uniref:Zn(2)-C6 fungal-type domain-containing protein n=1 Tax=Hydnum rufescens UP504 TaxID=1448309 RepID=A0A9P6DTT0_9AGAM|nr:hypothetical protein BS47DRAFT_1485011 [Hydnum rufescens UP504]